MWIILIVGCIVSGVCTSIVTARCKEESFEEYGVSTGIQGALVCGVLVGIVVYQIAAFNMEYNSSLDLYDRDGITPDAVLYVTMKIFGALTVIEHLIQTGFVIAKEIRRKNRSEHSDE